MFRVISCGSTLLGRDMAMTLACKGDGDYVKLKMLKHESRVVDICGIMICIQYIASVSSSSQW